MNEDAMIRRANLIALKLTPKDLATKAGYGRYTYWRDMMENDKKSFGEKAARRLEEALELSPRGCLDDPDGCRKLQKRDTPHQKLVVVGTTPEKTSTETQGAGVQEVTQSASMSPPDARDISPQSAPATEIPTFMSYSKPRLHSTILLLGSLLGALDDTSRLLIAVLLKKLTEDPDGAADYAERAVANAKVQRRLVADDRLDKVLTTLSEGTTENGGLK